MRMVFGRIGNEKERKTDETSNQLKVRTKKWQLGAGVCLPKFYFRILFTTLFLGLPVLVFNVFSPVYSYLCVSLDIRLLQSRFHHPVSHSALDPSFMANLYLYESYNIINVYITCDLQ